MNISKKSGVLTTGSKQVEVELVLYRYSYKLIADKRTGMFDGVPADVQFTSGVHRTTKQMMRYIYFRTGTELWYARLPAEDWHSLQEAPDAISATTS